MKQTCFLISTLLFVITLFLSNGFAQGYVHYATLPVDTGLLGKEMVFSPDGQKLATWGDGRGLDLWDATIGAHLHTFTEARFISDVSFDPNGHTLASGSTFGTVCLWDIVTGKQLRTFTLQGSGPFNVLFSPDGQKLAIWNWEGLHLWDVAIGKQLYTFTSTVPGSGAEPGSGFWTMLFSPDGQKLASGFGDGTIRLWDVTTGKQLCSFMENTQSTPAYIVSFNPDGQVIASWSLKEIRLWDVITSKHLWTLTWKDIVWTVSFSHDGQTVATGYWDDGTIYLWNAVTGAHLQTLKGHTARVTSVCFSPDGSRFASGSLDQTIRFWKLSTPRPVEHYSPTLPKTTANQIYDNAIRSVMWIVNPDISEGSGVLIDKKFKLTVTNAHVTGKQNTVDVYFPAPDENGELIKDRNFYLTNSSVLKRLGYYTKGHIVARNEEMDLAIIKLDGLPETVREIDWNFSAPTTNEGDLVYILGNPGGQDLWRWTLGEFLNDHGAFLHIQSDVFGGNSGGPVLNKQGILIGIVARSDKHMNALAIPVRDINRLLSQYQLQHSRAYR